MASRDHAEASAVASKGRLGMGCPIPSSRTCEWGADSLNICVEASSESCLGTLTEYDSSDNIVFGNNQPDPSVALTGPTTVSVTVGRTDGMLSLSWTITYAGRYTLAVDYGSGNSHSYIVTVLAGAFDASSTIAYGSGLDTGLVASSRSVHVQLKDSLGNNVTEELDANMELHVVLALQSGAQNSISPTTNYISDGVYNFSYSTTAAGVYTLSVSQGNKGISGSPFTVSLNPLDLDPSKSTMDTCSDSACYTAGVASQVVIQARDEFSNPLTSGGGTFVASLDGYAPLDGGASSYPNVAFSVSYDTAGKYFVQFTSTRSGEFSVAVDSSGTGLAGSPMAVVVAAASASPSTSFLVGSGLSNARADETSSFSLTEVDEFGNLRTLGESEFDVTLGSLAVSCSGQGNGTSVCSYKPRISETMSLAVQFGVDHISGSPFSVMVAPDEDGLPADFVVEPSGSASGVAGIVSTITLRARDKFQNLRTTSVYSADVSLIGPKIVSEKGEAHYMAPLNVSNSGDGAYVVSQQATYAGDYRLELFLHVGDGTLRRIDTPESFKLVVVAGEPFPAVTEARGAGMIQAESTVSTSFSLFSFDRFSNPIEDMSFASAFVVSLHPVTACDESYGAATINGSVSVVAGEYVATYTATASGWYSSVVTLNEEMILDSPFCLYVEAGPTVPSKCRLEGSGLLGGDTSRQLEILVRAVDIFGNVWKATPSVEDHGDASVNVTGVGPVRDALVNTNVYPSEGGRTVLLTATAAGRYSISVSWNNAGVVSSVIGSPVTVYIAAGPVDPAKTFAASDYGVATAGNALSFAVLAHDQYGNALFNSSSTEGDSAFMFSGLLGSTVNVTGAIAGSSMGTFVAEYGPTVAGQYKLHIMYNGVHIQGSPYDANVVAGETAAAGCTVVDASNLSATAGQLYTISMLSRDSYMNARIVGGDDFAVTTTDAGAGTPNVSVADLGTGTYNIVVGITVAGEFRVDVSYKSESIGSSPLSVLVVPAPSNAASSSVEASDLQTVDADVEFRISSHDSFGNFRGVGGDSYSIVCSRVAGGEVITGLVTDLLNGTFVGVCGVTIAGSYSVSVELEGQNVYGSPLVTVIRSGAVRAGVSEAFGNGLTVATAGVSGSFQVAARDVYGNMLDYGGANVLVALEQSESGNLVDANVVDNGDGRYNVSVVTTKAGTYSVAVTLDGTSIKSSPFSLQSYPGVLDARTSTIDIQGEFVSTAGIAASFKLTSRDEFGNEKSQSSTADFAVSLVQGEAIDGNLAHGEMGTYIGDFSVTRSGWYSLLVSVDGVNVSNSPMDVKILPAETDGQSCIASGEGLSYGIVASNVTFSIVSTDKYGNSKSLGGNNFQIHVKHDWPFFDHEFNAEDSVDQGDGSSLGIFVTTVAGPYALSILSGGNHIKGSPFRPNVGSETTFAGNSVAFGGGLRHSIAGEGTSFTVQAVDRFGNNRTVGGEVDYSVLVSWSSGEATMNYKQPVFGGASFLEGHVNDVSDGTLSISHPTTVAADYSLSVLYGGAHIFGSPFVHTVHATASYGPHCTADWNSNVSRATAGEVAEFHVQTRDVYWNDRTLGSDLFEVSVNTSGRIPGQDEYPRTASFSGASEPKGDGRTCIKVLATISAIYTVDLVGVGGGILDNDISMAVLPAEVNSPESLVDQSVLNAASAGEIFSFAIQARDVYGNNATDGTDTFTIVFSPHSGDTDVRAGISDVTNYGNGKYQLNYVLTVTGGYAMSVERRGLGLSGSPFDISVDAGPTAARKCVSIGEGLKIVTAGEDATFQISTKDMFENLRSVGGDLFEVSVVQTKELDGTSLSGAPATVSGSVIDEVSGSYRVDYTVSRSGLYSVNILKDGVPIGEGLYRSPFSVLVSPGALSPVDTTVTGEGLSIATVSKVIVVSLFPRDRFGNALGGSQGLPGLELGASSGGETSTSVFRTVLTLAFKLSGDSRVFSVMEKHSTPISQLSEDADNTVRASIKYDDTDGSFQIAYTVHSRGNWSIGFLIGGLHVLGSPFQTSVYPYAPSPSAGMTTAFGSGIVSAAAGMRTQFDILSRNMYGVRLTVGGEDVSVSLSGPTEPSVEVRDMQDGSYSASYVVTKTGPYRLSVQIRSEHVSGSPFDVNVRSHRTMPVSSRATGIPPTVVAGESSAFLIQSRDIFGNKQDRYALYGPDMYVVSINRDGDDVDTTTTDFEDGEYEVAFSATRSGNYRLIATLRTIAIGGTPAFFNVLPAGMSPAVSVVSGAGTVSGVAGEDLVLSLKCYDMYGNVVENGVDPESFIVTRNEAVSPVGEFSVESFSYVGAGVFMGSYAVHKSGIYEVNVKSKSVDLIGSPFSASVEPSALSPRECFNLSAVPSVLVAGDSYSFSVQTADAFSNLLTSGGGKFLVQLRGVGVAEAPVSDVGDGRISVTISSEVSGDNYVVEVLAENAEGLSEHIHGSPFSTIVVASSTDGARSTVVGIGLQLQEERIVVDESSSFSVVARDRFGNLRSLGGDVVTATLIGPSEVHAGGCVLSNGSHCSVVPLIVEDLCGQSSCGRYASSYSSTKSGNYRLDIMVDGVHAVASPFLIEISPSDSTEPTLSSVYGLGSTTALTGSLFTFSVEMRDVYNNTQTVASTPLRVDLVGPRLLDAKVQPGSDGGLSVELSAEEAGTYKLSAKMSGLHVIGSPTQIQFNPPGTGLESSILVGSGLASAIAGSEAVFVIDGRDDISRAVIGNRKPTVVVERIVDNAVDLSMSVDDVTEVGSFQWRATYRVLRDGQYRVHVHIVCDDSNVYCSGGRPNLPFPGSPFAVSASPGSYLADKSVAYGGGIVGAVVGHQTEFYVMLKDLNENEIVEQVVTSSMELRISLECPDEGGSHCEDKEVNGVWEYASTGDHRGRYRVTYTVPAVGDWKLSTRLFSPIQGMPRIITAVSNNPAAAGMSEAMGHGLKSAVAGEAVQFSIQARGASGIDVVGHDQTFYVQLVASISHVFHKSVGPNNSHIPFFLVSATSSHT